MSFPRLFLLSFALLSACTVAEVDECALLKFPYTKHTCKQLSTISPVQKNFFPDISNFVQHLPYYKFCRRGSDANEGLATYIADRTRKLSLFSGSPNLANASFGLVPLNQRYIDQKIFPQDVKLRGLYLSGPFSIETKTTLSSFRRKSGLSAVRSGEWLEIIISKDFKDRLCKFEHTGIVNQIALRQKVSGSDISALFRSGTNEQVRWVSARSRVPDWLIREELNAYFESFIVLRLMLERNLRFEAQIDWAIGHELFHLVFPLDPQASCNERLVDELRADYMGALLAFPHFEMVFEARRNLKRGGYHHRMTLGEQFDHLIGLLSRDEFPETYIPTLDHFNSLIISGTGLHDFQLLAHEQRSDSAVQACILPASERQRAIQKFLDGLYSASF